MYLFNIAVVDIPLPYILLNLEMIYFWPNLYATCHSCNDVVESNQEVKLGVISTEVKL